MFLYAAFAALASLGMRPEGRTTLLRWSRNFLLLGTAVFLAGEFSGFTWRMQWMGDYWCWNANFLEATLFFPVGHRGSPPAPLLGGQAPPAGRGPGGARPADDLPVHDLHAFGAVMERLSSLKFTLGSLSRADDLAGPGGVSWASPSCWPPRSSGYEPHANPGLAPGTGLGSSPGPLLVPGPVPGGGGDAAELWAFCTFTRLLPRLRAGNALKGWLLTLVHLVMLVVLLGHGAEMAMGHKQEELRMLPGQTLALPEGLTLSLESVRFTSATPR